MADCNIKVELAEVSIPPCPAEGLLIRTTVTAISTGTEIRVYRAIPVDAEGQFLHTGVPFALPAENGYSLVGQIVEVGPQAQGFKVGDRVFAGVAELPSDFGYLAFVHGSQVLHHRIQPFDGGVLA